MSSSIVRTDRWGLNPSEATAEYLKFTIVKYQEFCKALAYVVKFHWAEISTAKSQCSSVERLIHATTQNPNPKYCYFGKRFHKFPSDLRRAAIQFVCGQVSSFYTRYQRWQDGIRLSRAANPPGFNVSAGCYPVLYKGGTIKFHDGQSIAEIKVWNGSDWIWASVPIVNKWKRHLVDSNKQLSPSLIQSKKGFHLSVPFKCHPQKLRGDVVCAVDVGINTLATVSIVNSSGTVIARAFIHPTVDIDRRDKQATLIRQAAKKSKKLHKGFCAHRYRKAKQYNQNIANQSARKVINFALKHGASVIVFEDLRRWRPKGKDI